jgi:hypothetical protein
VYSNRMLGGMNDSIEVKNGMNSGFDSGGEEKVRKGK